jgi:hypothetical protein
MPFNLVCRCRRRASRKGTRMGYNLRPKDPLVPKLHWVLNEDAGGASSKWTLRLLDVDKPCGNKTCSIICSAEPKKPQEKKPNSSSENYVKELATIDGAIDMGNMSVVQLGGKWHCAVPKQTVADAAAPPVVNVSAPEAEDFKAKLKAPGGALPERAAARMEEKNPAELVCFGGECLGVRAGELCFGFRGRVTAEEAESVVVFETEVYASMDLLALSAALGMEGQSGCTCCWCRLSAPEFKKVAKGEVDHTTVPRRDLATQLADLTAYNAAAAAAKAKGNKNRPLPQKGVRTPNLLNVHFLRVIPPFLHLGLGLVNNCVKEIQKSLDQLDGVDPVAAALLLEKTRALLELEVTISKHVEELADLLGESGVAEVQKTLKKMKSVRRNVRLAEEGGGAVGSRKKSGGGKRRRWKRAARRRRRRKKRTTRGQERLGRAWVEKLGQRRQWRRLLQLLLPASTRCRCWVGRLDVPIGAVSAAWHRKK